MAGLACLAACKPGDLGPAKQYSQIDYAHGGTVTGVVHLTHPVPKSLVIDMAGDPACAMAADAGGNDMTADYVVSHGDLANVLVSVSKGLEDRKFPITRTPDIVDQHGCRFHPHVSAAMVGQEVRFTNSDDTLHNVHMSPTVPGNAAFDISQRPGANPISRNFREPELMIAVRCNNHPWMHSYLNILANPFFAVTDANGDFTIRGLPPGTYTLTTDQEKLGKSSAVIHVAANETVHQDFSY